MISIFTTLYFLHGPFGPFSPAGGYYFNLYYVPGRPFHSMGPLCLGQRAHYSVQIKFNYGLLRSLYPAGL